MCELTAKVMASSSGSAKKSKHLVLSLESKIAILEQLKTEVTRVQLVEGYRTRTLTVGDIKKKEAKIRPFASTMDSMDISKKGCMVQRLADDDKLDETVYLWFTQKLSQDMLVSRPVLCEKAAQLHKLLQEGESVPPFKIVWVGFGIFANVMEYGSSLCREKRYLLTPLR